MRTLDRRLSDLLLEIYESAAAPVHWDIVLQNVATEMGATKASMHVHEFAGRAEHKAGSRLHSFGYERASAEVYARHYAVHDPYVNSIRKRFWNTGVGTSDVLITETELKKTEFYVDYGRPNGIFFVAWTVIEQNDRFGSGLALVRPEQAKQFAQKQVEFLNLLNPHLEKALRLERALEGATENNNALLLSVAQLDFAVLALDDKRSITNVSAPAKALLDEKDAIQFHKGHIEATDPNENVKLQAMVTAASRPWENPHTQQGDALLLSRRSGKRPLQVVVFPFTSTLASGSLLGADRPRVLILLSDPVSRHTSRETVLRSLYRLTATEARLADLLLQGCDVKEAAERMKITAMTARYHLKQVFAKTDARRQSELIRLMLSLPGTLLR